MFCAQDVETAVGTMSSRFVICPSCQALNPSFEPSCDQCGAALADVALSQPSRFESSVSPREKIYPPPRTIVLIGIWAIFLPNFLGTAYGSFWLMTHHGGLAEFIALWGEVGLTCLSFVMLFRVTKRYFFRAAQTGRHENE